MIGFGQNKVSHTIIAVLFVLLAPVLYAQEDNIQSLKEKISTTKEDTAKVGLLLEIALAYTNIDKNKSINSCKQACQLSESLQNEEYYCKSIVKLAYYQYLVGNLDSSLNTLAQSEKRVLALRDSSAIAEMYIIQGSIFRRHYDFEKAKDYLLKGIKYSGSTKNQNVGNAYNRIGIIHDLTAEYDSAISYYIKSRMIFEAIHDSIGMVKTYINSGEMNLEMKNYENAEAQFMESLSILKNKYHPRFESLTYNNLGILYSKLNKYEAALNYYNKAYIIADEIGNEFTKGDVINNIGDIYVQQGLYEKALRQFEKSLFIFHDINYIEGEITSRINIAVMYKIMKQYQTSLLMLDTCLSIAKENNMLQRERDVYDVKTKVFVDMGLYKKAYSKLRNWIDLNDSIFNLAKSEVVADLELKYEKEKNESKILVLQNEALQKDIEIKQKINQRNLISGGGIAAVIILSLLFFLHRQRSRKDRIIKEKEILRLKEEKKALAAQSIVEGQEEERKRVARELHDGLGVLLSNVKMQFSSFMDKSVGNKELLTKAASVLNQASIDVRRISHNMMPGNLNKFGLVAAIEDLFEELNDVGKIKAEIKDDLADERFSENMEIMLYRIVQELVNNTIKHSGASAISLNLNKFDHKILVRYADNGSGFDPEKAKSSKSMGLKSIEDRINFLGGELSIESALGKGSSFNFDFPI